MKRLALLLLAGPIRTIVVAGDAAVTAEHVLAGRVWAGANDTTAAMESLTDLDRNRRRNRLRTR